MGKFAPTRSEELDSGLALRLSDKVVYEKPGGIQKHVGFLVWLI